MRRPFTSLFGTFRLEFMKGSLRRPLHLDVSTSCPGAFENPYAATLAEEEPTDGASSLARDAWKILLVTGWLVFLAMILPSLCRIGLKLDLAIQTKITVLALCGLALLATCQNRPCNRAAIAVGVCLLVQLARIWSLI